MNVDDITYLWPGPNPRGPREKWGQGRLQFGRYVVSNLSGRRLVIRMLRELYAEDPGVLPGGSAHSRQQASRHEFKRHLLHRPNLG